MPHAEVTRRHFVGGAAGLVGAGILGGCSPRNAGSGRFKIAMNQTPTTLDISTAPAGSTNSTRPLLENVIEGLMGRDTSGKIIPALGVPTISEDGKSVSFSLRRGVTFHNGAAFTAHDVLFSHERWKSYSVSYRTRLRDFKSIEILDDFNVAFHFINSAIGFTRAVGFYIASKDHHDAVGEERFAKELIGTGPYRISGYEKFQYADLDAYEGYWGGEPEIKRARVMFVIEDMTRIAMLRSGEADLIMAAPFSTAPMLRSAGFVSAQTDMHPTFSVRFQLANPNTPWADRRVRLAIAHGIDCQAIIKGVFGGIPRHYAGFAPGEEGYDPNLRPFTYDPDRSRALLRESGYAEGFRMPLVYWTGAYYGLRETTEAVILYLRRIGIECEVSGVDTTRGLEMNRAAAKDRNARLVSIAPALYASTPDPAQAMRQGYASASPYSWYNNPEFDSAVRTAEVTRDDKERADALRSCSAMLRQDMPIIPIWNNVVLYMMRSGVGYTPTGRDIPGMQIKNIALS